MSYRVRIDSFEGPFDLLLTLVNRQKVDIGSVSVTHIIDQYLEEMSHLQSVDLDVASDFLVVAATLLSIKAKNLIPNASDVFDEEIGDISPSEARDTLVERLIRYKHFKNVASYLSERLTLEGKIHFRQCGPEREFLHKMPDFLRTITLDGIASYAYEVFTRGEIDLFESRHIALTPPSVQTYIRNIYGQILHSKKLCFSDIVKPTDPAPLLVVSFLAILELYKRAYISLQQSCEFGDIEIIYIEGSGDLLLEDTEELPQGV